MSSPSVLQDLRRCLCSLQDHLLQRILLARAKAAPDALAAVAAHTAADTLYEIDRITESTILQWFATSWPANQPVQLVMEGIDDDQPLTFPSGTPVDRTHWKLIMDPIDGTRNLMFDKRAAWTLAGLAPQKGAHTGLHDITVAAMTQLPTTREWRSDQLSTVRGQGLHAEAFDVRSGTRQTLRLSPSRDSDCRHGFATVTRFFPDGLAVLGHLEEELWNRVYPDSAGGSPLVFNDQYLTTGGQLYELLIGHDRFIADLRPLAFRKLGLPASLAAHPYDLAASLLAEEAGVLLEDPLSGQPLQAPLDTTTPVAWVGYANQTIADHLRPTLKEVIRRFL